jgi:hypothetical protein
MQPDRPWETTPEAQAAAAEEKQAEKKFNVGCLSVLGVAAVIIFAMLASSDSDDDSIDPIVEQFDAERVCQDFVKDRLVAPATAEFESSVSGLGPEYTVTGTVDAQNALGATVRNDFSCTVRGDGSTWRLSSLTVN